MKAIVRLVCDMNMHSVFRVLYSAWLRPHNRRVRWGLVATMLFGFALPGLCTTQQSSSRREENDVYLQIACRKYSLHDPAIPHAILHSLWSPAAASVTESGGTVWQATPAGLIEVNPVDKLKRVLTGKDGLPILSITGIAGERNGRLWLATAQGAILFAPRAEPNARWFYFWGQRYLSDNQVLQIVAEDGGAWIRTQTGISHIELKPYTLEEKSTIFLKRIQQRHRRYGYVAGCDLLRAGDPASFRMRSEDNDGLWTSIYVAAESFRYATTHSPEALENARTSLAAMLRLVSITGIPGFPARSLIHKGDQQPQDGEWHWTSDGQWKWKGDTSSDELVGHFFAYWVAYQLLPGEKERAAIRSAVESIADALIEHQLQLVGYGGRVTTWGRSDPEYLRDQYTDERALDSVELLSHLGVAYKITGESKFLEAYRHVAKDLGYAANVARYAESEPPEINYSDEQLAFLSFYPLLNIESDPELRKQYQAGLARLWLRVRSEKNPLWDFIYAQNTGAPAYDQADAIDTLERIPLSTVTWTVNNSQRADLAPTTMPDRHGRPQSQSYIPPNERAIMKWNSNPFALDGGDNGQVEDDGAFFLLPYWLGRYYRLIPVPESSPSPINRKSHTDGSLLIR